MEELDIEGEIDWLTGEQTRRRERLKEAVERVGSLCEVI